MTPGQIKAAWWIGSVVVVAIVVSVLFWKPILGFMQGRIEHWQAKEETATDTAVSNGAEADGQAALGTAQGQIATNVVERHTETIRYVEKASAAPDAKAPLGYDRSQRVADHTASLCQQRPAVCARGASPEGSDPGVR